MPFSLDVVDILFLVTVVLLVFNGLRNGFVFSLVNLISLPVAAVVALVFGPSLTALLGNNRLSSIPLGSYLGLFLGAVVGFVEAWALWVVLLLVLGHFLNMVNQAQIQQLGFHVSTFQTWQQFYNDAIGHSLFARVNGWFIQVVPVVQTFK